jgi:ATP-dependent HslUV protease ATP-binding subunit HslU
VEATKFTEVGYVGRDVDSIVSELVESGLTRIYEERVKEVEPQAEKIANERLIAYLAQQMKKPGEAVKNQMASPGQATQAKPTRRRASQRDLAKQLSARQLEDQIVEIEVEDSPDMLEQGMDSSFYEDDLRPGNNLGEFVDNLRCKAKNQQRKLMSVKEARRILTQSEVNKLLNYNQMVDDAVQRTQESGVVFIDELDKLVGPRVEIGRDISGEGVQRDLLPLLDGTNVMTRYGPVKTKHVLFVTAGAFYHYKPSDLIPELQGRLPLRVELKALSKSDLERILTEPKNSLTRQYQALMSADNVTVEFTEDAVAEMASVATVMNDRVENIGARRLNTIMERVMEDLNFSGNEKAGETVIVDREYVHARTANLVKDENLSRYIL